MSSSHTDFSTCCKSVKKKKWCLNFGYISYKNNLMWDFVSYCTEWRQSSVVHEWKYILGVRVTLGKVTNKENNTHSVLFILDTGISLWWCNVCDQHEEWKIDVPNIIETVTSKKIKK